MVRRHRMAVLALDKVLPMEAGMPFQIFADRPQLNYSVTLCGAQAGPVATTGGFNMHATGDLKTVRAADTVIIPAFRPFDQDIEPPVLDAIRAAHRRGARIVSICAGAFALAATGLLDGKSATTHWRRTDELARRYPQVRVLPDVLFVDEGSVLTSAGVASGIDICLHLVRLDHGAAIANAVARAIVAAPYRDGGQAQYIRHVPEPDRQSALATTRAWALQSLADPLTVVDLARNAHTSERTFARTFLAETGTTPLKWLNAARIDRARELLEVGDRGIDQIAAECGLGTPANLRAHFRRVTGVSPSEYRRTFTGA